MSGREKVWLGGAVKWVELLDVEEPEEETEEDLMPELMLALEILTERQRFVISLRYGLKDGKAYSHREIAVLMGVDHSAVVRHEQAAIERMRRHVTT